MFTMLVTYDLNSSWWEVKQAAIANGFVDFIISDAGTRVPLPNTSLLVHAESPKAAMDRFIAVVRTFPGVKIEKAAAFDWSTARMHSDTKTDPLSAYFLSELVGGVR